MKKTGIAFVLSLVLCLFFCFGCGEKQEPEKPEDPAPGPEEVTATKIEVSGAKTEFGWREEFSSEGLVVTATFSDGTTRQLAPEEYRVSSVLYDAQNLGSYTIQVLYGSLKARYTVQVVYKPAAPMGWEEDGVLKILMVGNSYSDDAIAYVYQIAEAMGVEASLGNLYIGNCSLLTHLNNLRNDTKTYEYRVANKTTGGIWNTTENASAIDAIKAEDWDYISLQQNSTDSGHPDTYSSIEGILTEIAKYNTTAKLVWHMPWADAADSKYSGNVMQHYGNDMMTMYRAYVDAVKQEILGKRGDVFAAVLPTGTAIQNARTSFLGPNNGPLNRDGHHLSVPLGRYIASLTMFAVLTGYNLNALAYAPRGVTTEQKSVAIESAMNAVSSPLTVTQSKYPG